MLGFNLRLGHPARQAPARAFNALTTALFRNGEQGFAYDHNDFATLFQDAAGTTPVTAADQPVGLQLDKSKGLVLGSELVVDGGFDSGISALPYIVRGIVAHSSSAAVLTTTSISGTSGVAVALVDPLFVAIGRYEVKITIRARSVANASHRLLVAVSTAQNSGLSATERFYAPGVGTYTGLLSATSGDTLTITSVDGVATVGDTFTIDNISVKEIPGNHRSQTAAASRPMLRYNAATGSYYLQYDGTDDFLQTNAIDFTATDKVSLFAGVRKLSDAASGTVCELGNNQANSFRVFAPASAGADKYAFEGGATTTPRAYTTSTLFSAPNSAVLSAQGRILSDINNLRLNGSQASQTTLDQGVGNYGNYPMYFGRRGGTTLPFNGHEYSLICVGRLTTAAEIANIERLLARQVGVPLV